MKKMLSYVLFGSNGRYWKNLPYILVANSAIYPTFTMRFYVHSECSTLLYFNLLKELSKVTDRVEMELIDIPYKNTQLTTWRMKPLWEDNIEFLFCRDIDYLINKLERSAVQFFLNSSKGIHGIRSYHLHTTPLMAGLCGFRREKVIKKIKQIAFTFEDYLKWGEENVDYCKKGWIWGCDQALLKFFFQYVGLFSDTLDCPQFDAPKNIIDFNPTVVECGYYENIDIEDCDNIVLTYSDLIATGFTGRSNNITTEQMKILFGMVDNDICKIVKGYVSGF